MAKKTGLGRGLDALFSDTIKEPEIEEVTGEIVQNVIPRNVKLSEAPSYGMPITLYDPRSKGAKSYEKFTREFLKINEEEQKAAKHMKKGE